MDNVWEADRMKLFCLIQEHPQWSIAHLAQALQRSLSWVKKWRKRFKESDQPTLSMFKSRSRAPKTRPKQMTKRVRMAILSFRDQLKAIYNRVVGPKTILYHLHTDPLLQDDYVPRSSYTVWRVLKEGGRIPTRVRDHHPVERPAPMCHWELDFGQLADQVEFLSVVDRGTSILVNTQAKKHYTAETALLAIYHVLKQNGLPQKLRFDRDSRLVGSWGMDEYPSSLLRFLLNLGIEPDPTPPRRPDLKPFVERSIRTIKYEYLQFQLFETPEKTQDQLDEFRHFYNHHRMNQSSACNNRPPYIAFPTLPTLPQLPQTVNPDAWLGHYHQRIFKRKLNDKGATTIDKHWYRVGYKYANKTVAFQLDAHMACFDVIYQGKRVKQFEVQGLYGQSLSMTDYLVKMLEETRQG
jgi:hypothetical protein